MHIHFLVRSVENVLFTAQLCCFRMLYLVTHHQSYRHAFRLRLEEGKMEEFQEIRKKIQTSAILNTMMSRKNWGYRNSHFHQSSILWDLLWSTHGIGNLIVFLPRAAEPFQTPTPSYLMQRQHSFGSCLPFISFINSSYQQKQTSTAIPTTLAIFHINN